jgi:hypothetical protein
MRRVGGASATIFRRVDLRDRIDHEIHSITGIRMRVELVATRLARSEGKTQRVCDHRLALKADPSALPWPPLRQRPTRAANAGSATFSRKQRAAGEEESRARRRPERRRRVSRHLGLQWKSARRRSPPRTCARPACAAAVTGSVESIGAQRLGETLAAAPTRGAIASRGFYPVIGSDRPSSRR